MKTEYFCQHLTYILHWWADFVDWENGGIFTWTRDFKKEKYNDHKAPLMHLRQLYNYSVGHEAGFGGADKIAAHLYDTLPVVFPERQGALMISSPRRQPDTALIEGYLNAYQVICLSRFARTFQHREAAENALKVYRELDALFTDVPLASQGTWDTCTLDHSLKNGKSDNAHIHRCEAALNLYRALKVAAPELAEKESAYLLREMQDLCHFFDQRISRPDAGYTVEHMQNDCRPHPHTGLIQQSLAHGFEWLGFCLEIETHTGLELPFMNDRMQTLCRNTLKNGLAPNGCFRNDYYPDYRMAQLRGTFWPQVEAVLGALWARKRWGECAFPLEEAARMLGFYEKYFIIPEDLGGGIMNSVSENGCPGSFTCGHPFKCDHHAVRMCEKVLEYDLLGAHPV